MTPKATERAARVGDGFIFGTTGAEYMKQATPQVREAFAAEGKKDIEVAGLAYVAIGDDPQKALAEGAHHVLRYYGQLLTEPENLIHHGPAQKIAEEVAAYADAGIDTLILFAEIASLDQVGSSSSTCCRRIAESEAVRAALELVWAGRLGARSRLQQPVDLRLEPGRVLIFQPVAVDLPPSSRGHVPIGRAPIDHRRMRPRQSLRGWRTSIRPSRRLARPGATTGRPCRWPRIELLTSAPTSIFGRSSW